ncbi:MerR family DNA-binding transcriptional regulator (plasmid) [Ralstonia solanacearum]|uniref:MerR family DNA-binding transcriptional regulator n=2 Tax=Ralstonia solanacearum species complex TaxID=3116862 RepID=A0A0S4WW14_RALSL|nr:MULTISPECIES: MerR family transcriptional regulator [Ralstonia]AUS44317.1 MerR family DNA-binding transcriptional regulator [Ralstonia solanacearum]AYA48438.1 MerR family DNA-binding transcriptional regulator [Ralstonia pseudosolanacearum]MCK4135264.1 MerR family transcriptional regulator [Ralstonia pseudosolanacearum]MCK4145113.1 MerR family transcriptional regulator [Ralstonia pseudosolanacearum]MDK1383176.1 MerR family transcriptional regulator [Ralstonia pseudosolanacearum]
MKIGELARMSGVAASRIRFYEANGLLQPAQRQANGYREYAPETLTRLEIILRAQDTGFSLEEIRALLPPDQGDWPHDELLQALRRKVSEIALLEQRLAQNKRHLVALIKEMEASAAGEDCAGRAKRVLERMHQEARRAPTGERPARLAKKRA